MDENGAPPEVDFSSIPLIDRCVDKNWKARLSAYNDLIAKFSKTTSDDDPFFRPYLNGDLLKKWVTDSNAVAQEKGVEAVGGLVRESGENSARTRSEVVPALVDKCLGSTRAGTKNKAIELILLYVEVENQGEGVVTDVLKGLDAKQPKLVAATISALKELVNAFGIKTLGDPKSLIKAVNRGFGNNDKTVRAEATLLAQSLYKYLGPALPPSLTGLKPVQLKELTESFAAMDEKQEGAGTGKAGRLTRRGRREEEEREAAGGGEAGEGDGGAGEAEEAEAIDPLSLVEAVDIIPLLPSTFHETITSTKWKDKSDLIADCMKIIDPLPKIVDSPGLGDIANALGKRMGDTNVNVVSGSAGMLIALAGKVQNRGMGKYRAGVVPHVLERLKEKKTMETLGKLLDAMFETVTLSDMVEDCVNALQSKNPMVRQGTLQFLARALSSTKTPPTKSDLDALAPAFVSQLSDSLEPIRSAAADGLGCLSKIFGERPMNAFLDGITDAQKGKVTDAMGKMEVKCKAGTKPAAKPAAPAAAAEPAAKPAPKMPARLAARMGGSKAPESPKPAAKAAAPPAEEERIPSPVVDGFGGARPSSSAAGSSAPSGSRPPSATPAKGPPARLTARAGPPAAKKPAPPPARAAAAKSGGGKAAPAPVSFEVKYKYSPEEAEAQAADIIPADIQTGLGDAQWKERLAAAERLLAWVEEGNAVNQESEILFRYMGKNPGWNEKNFQVSGKIFATMTALAEKCPSFGKSSAAQAIGQLSDKLGDIKLKKPASDALLAFAEKTSLGFVLSEAYEAMTKQKAPKAQADALTWVKQAIIDFGIKGLALKDIINFLKVGLQSANGTVRSSATAVLVTVKLFVPTDLSSFLEDLNPTLLTTIEKEFEKISGQAAPEPTRFSADLSAGGGDDSGPAAGADDPLEDLIPRVDLNKLVVSTGVVKDAKSDNWKDRKAAFELLLSELERNTRLKPEMGEIGNVLRIHLDDSNLSVKLACLGIISKIASGMGQPFTAHARMLATAVANVLADQKVGTRNAAVDTLNVMAEMCQGTDTMIPAFATSLEKPNPALRGGLLGFLAGSFATFPPKVDLGPLIPGTLASLEDRNGDVRKAGQAVLPYIILTTGIDQVLSQVNKLKPASKASVTPLVQAAKTAAAALGPAPAPVEAAPVKAVEPKPSLARSVNKPAAAPAREVQASAMPEPKAEPVRPRGMQMKANALRATAASAQDASDYQAPAFGRPSAATSAMPARLKLGLKRPIASASVPEPVAKTPPPEAVVAPFHTVDGQPKSLREKRDLARWSFDTNSLPQLLEYLQKQMVDHASPEIMGLLFSTDRFAEKDHMAGLIQLDELYTVQGGVAPFGLDNNIAEDIRFANMDLALKYIGIRIQDGSTQIILKCLELVTRIVQIVDNARRGFSEAESDVILPALIAKLGDNKFKDRLLAIFNLIDHTMPSSRVMQAYVEHGISSTNSKTRAAAMELLAQLIKRRGDVAASATNAPKLYKRIAEFIASPDNATRSAALDCIAYMYHHTGDAVLQMVGNLPPKDRDLLKNRIDKLAPGSAPAAKTSQPGPGGIGHGGSTSSPPRAALAAVAGTPNRQASASSPRGSPAQQTSTIPVRKTGLTAPAGFRPQSNLAKVAQPNAEAGPSRGQRLKPLNGHQPSSDGNAQGPVDENTPRVANTIRAIRNADAGVSVDALKKMQRILEVSPDEVDKLVNPLVEALVGQLYLLFEEDERIAEPPMFRLAKHLIQTLSNFCDRGHLVDQISAGNMANLLEQLSLGLLTTDTAKGDVKDMSKFMNMTILRLFATGKRITIFDSLFKLLLSLVKRLGPSDSEGDLKARHAELILKCVWKRARTVEEDFQRGVLHLQDLFTILEEFLQEISPKDWRFRAAKKVPLGDMPLRTIKVLIQHAISTYGRGEAIGALQEVFPGEAESTFVYEYIYRLTTAKPDEQAARGSSAAREAESAAIPPVPSLSVGNLVDYSEDKPEPQDSPRVSLVVDDLDDQLYGLVKSVSGAGGAKGEAIAEVSTFLKANPSKEAKFTEMLNAVLGDSSYKLFIKRKLANLNAATGDPASLVSPPQSPNKPERGPAPKRLSVAPGPPIPADADADTQLAMLKDKLQFFAQSK